MRIGYFEEFWGINWLFDILGICPRHWIRTEWDGTWLTYICPKCFNEGRLKGKQ